MKSILLITLLLLTSYGFGQKVKAPKDITDGLTHLAVECSDSMKALIKETENDEMIELCYPWGGDFKTVFSWFDVDTKRSGIRKYLEKNGISDHKHQQTVVLVAFKTVLLGNKYDEQAILKPYQLIEIKRAQEDSVRFTTDSLRGIYIPKDLDDCFKQIDGFWSDSTKMEVKQWSENEFTGKAHMGFGMWMRNNWQLWGGSRLSKYFNDMGVYHPDDMSGIILDSYHRYLNGTDIKLEEQIKFYKDYWEKSK
jgi:hypothetical protein